MIITTGLSFANECQQMNEPSRTLCFQNLTTHRMLQEILNSQGQYPYPQQEPQAKFICSTICQGITSSYYDKSVKEFFSTLSYGVTDRLEAACRAVLHPKALKLGFRITQPQCKPLKFE